MTRTKYLTARCPTGCEAWLHPQALAGHLRPGRCRGHAWVEDLDDAVLVAAPVAATLTRVLPAEYVDRPTFSEDRILRRGPMPGDYLRDEVYQGIAVRSPVDGVRASRWLLVATAAARASGDDGVREALDGDGFADLERDLVDPADVVECPTCHDVVRRRGLGSHLAKNTACRWRRAAAEVRERWEQGARDPWSVPGAPLKWSDLQARREWRRRLSPVRFPAWVAVLVEPAGSP